MLFRFAKQGVGFLVADGRRFALRNGGNGGEGGIDVGHPWPTVLLTAFAGTAAIGGAQIGIPADLSNPRGFSPVPLS